MNIEVGDVVLQPSNDTWWLIYERSTNGGNYPYFGECVRRGTGHSCGERGMPFSAKEGHIGVELVPVEDLPEDLLVRSMKLRLLGGEVTDGTVS